MPKPTASTSGILLAQLRRPRSTIASITSPARTGPSTARCTRSCTSSCSSTTPASSLVPPRSTPITLRLMRGLRPAIAGTIRAGRAGDEPRRPESAQGRPPRCLPMPSEKPEYRVYRARRGLPEPPVLPARARALRAHRAAEQGTRPPAEDPPPARRPRPTGRGAAPRRRAAPARDAARRAARASPGGGGSPGSACSSACSPFIVFWIAAQLRALHDQRAGPVATRCSEATRAALDDSGNMLTSANNILVLGSDRRPGEKAAAAPTRSC